MNELVASGVIPSASNYWGTSALEIASLQGCEDVAIVLLAAGVPDNRTAELLVEWGADDGVPFIYRGAGRKVKG